MNKGFTLLELLIVIALVIILVALTFPIGLNFYGNQAMDETSSNIISALRKAQSQSIFQNNDSSFGVKFLSDSYVLFQGGSYGGRIQSEDEIFSLPKGVSVSGADEIVFSKLSGITAPRVLVISSRSYNQGISVNDYGKIERQ